MNRELLCRWLAVDAKAWPPDPYTLLGLPQGACDLAQIEQCVHDRMAKLRGYQISHPEEATEGMNRLAQAFVSLSETAARQAAAKPANGAVRARVQDETAVGHKTIVDWTKMPPPVRRPGDSGSMPVAPAAPAEPAAGAPVPDQPIADAPVADVPLADAATAAAPAEPTAEVPKATPHRPPPADPRHNDVEQLTQSQVAKAGIGTLEALIDRIYQTRQLLVAWERAGVYLKGKSPGPAKNEERELSRRFREVQNALDGFPSIVGYPGKPGYRVVAMARLSMTASVLRDADEVNRELLQRDWESARHVLLGYRTFLRVQFKHLRRQGPMRLVWRAVRFFLNDHPVMTLTALALSALGAWGVYWLTR
jgi:hypothetical protein